MMLITNLICLFIGVVLGYYTCSYIIAKRCLEGTCELKLLNKGGLETYGWISIETEEHYED